MKGCNIELLGKRDYKHVLLYSLTKALPTDRYYEYYDLNETSSQSRNSRRFVSIEQASHTYLVKTSHCR